MFRNKQCGAGQAPVEEVVEAPDFTSHDLERRPPRGRPERGKAPGRVDDEVAIGRRAFANGDHASSSKSHVAFIYLSTSSIVIVVVVLFCIIAGAPSGPVMVTVDGSSVRIVPRWM